MDDLVDVSLIRDLNDQLRHSLNGGVLVMTAGVIALGAKRQMDILSAVAAFDSFDSDNDPYGRAAYGHDGCLSTAAPSGSHLSPSQPARAPDRWCCPRRRLAGVQDRSRERHPRLLE